jgi:hypothetical protein
MLIDDMLIGLILCGLVLAVAHIRADLVRALDSRANDTSIQIYAGSAQMKPKARRRSDVYRVEPRRARASR